MKSGLVSSVLFLIATLASGAAAREAGWGEDYQAALKQAKKAGKPILADFTGSDWCGWCKKLKKEVFDTPEFTSWAEKNVILLEVDFPQGKSQSKQVKEQNQKLQEQFQIEGYPTIVMIDGDGKEIGRLGYAPGGPKAWLAEADKALKKTGAPAADAASGESGDWLTSWDEALAQAKKTRKPILADFTGSDWCGWCMKLKAEVFDTKEFRDWAKKNVILLEVDFPKRKEQSDELKKQNEKLRLTSGVNGFPTIIFFDGKGKKVGQQMGYMEGGPAAWLKKADERVKQARGG